MPRKAHEPTDQLRRAVAEMVAIGLQQKQVARVLGLDVKTLAKHYKRDLEHGLARVTSEIGRSLIAKALGGDRHAMEFFLRARAGWRQDDPVNITASASAVAVNPVLVVPGQMNPEDWLKCSQAYFSNHPGLGYTQPTITAAPRDAAEERLRQARHRFERVVQMSDPISRRKIERAERVNQAIMDGTGKLDDY